MKNKMTAIALVVGVLLLIPIITSIAYLGVAVGIGYAFWHKDKLDKFAKDLKDVVSGE